MLVLVIGHQAAAQPAAFIERAAHINTQAIAIPATSLGAQLHVRINGGAFANQVDGGRWVAHATDQARGAAHDFHAVVHGRVLGVVVHVRRRGDAVDLEVADGKAP